MSQPSIPAGAWTLDPTHSRIGFSVRHLMVSKVRGSFGEFTAEVTIGENPLDSTLSAVVQMASIAGVDTVLKNPVLTMKVSMLGTIHALDGALAAVYGWHGGRERIGGESAAHVFGGQGACLVLHFLCRH